DWEMNRANAGCDLVAPADTPVFAVKDGKVVRGPAGYSTTGQAIEVDHGEFLARYCELKPMTKAVVKAGDAVKQGDVVGYVARGACVTMLHLEMYSGKAEGPLTVRPERIAEGDPDIVKRFRRRADLMDPTAWLDRAMVKGETAGAGEDEEELKGADDDPQDMMTETKVLITKEALKAAEESLSDSKCDAVLPHLRKYSKFYGVDTPLKAAHFLAQVGHESGFKATEEKLSYSESRMKQIFGCKSGKWKDNDCPVDSRLRKKLWDDPNNYAHKPENLANYVYADRLGNGSEESGDGYKYRGRGIIQLTGKSNYKTYTDFHNEKNKDDKQDFVANPEKVLETEYAVESAFAWWTWNKVNDLCVDDTEETIKKVSLKVNGGTVGLAERTKAFKAIKKVLDSNV
ncbi:MAG TPA: peptidoglycan DD-metalloendopeptidase family protein, partial [Fibrobacteria bacterium]|nr:peptidoglycan DD-metalloendopeptidase family protein [Fibrobacteria bacterium]